MTSNQTKCMSTLYAAVLLMALAACGGGGGSSSSQPVPPSGSVGSGGGTTSGTGGGGTSIVEGGLIPGGAGLAIDTSRTGVEFGVASGGSGASIDFGDIQAFSSVVLNDVTVATDSAEFLVEGATASQSDLKQGQQVLVISDASGTDAAGVFYRSNVKGPVTGISLVNAELGTAVLTVLGQSVRADAATFYSDATLATIQVGDLLEVSGTLTSSSDIQATFIERKSSLAEYKVIGLVSGLTATDFTVGGLTVNYSSATLQDFSGPLADGDVVEIKGDPASFTASDQLAASRVELLPTLTLGSSVPARIEGVIDRFASATDFDVQTTPVTTTSATTYVNGSSASLALNVKVQAEGSVDTNGVLVAQQVTIQRAETIRAEGHVESVDVGARTLSVLGVEFTARDLTIFEDSSSANQSPFDLGDIGVGDEVEVRGYLDGTQVIATEVEREDSEDRARLRGPVTAEDAASGTLEVLGVSLSGQAGVTVYEDINDVVISQAEFHDLVELGTIVNGDWDVFVDTSQVLDELSIED